MKSAMENLRSILNSKKAPALIQMAAADAEVGEIMKKVLNAKTEFRDRGQVKKASRIELTIRRLAASATNGDVASAAILLKMRAHAEKNGDTSPTIIRIFNALPCD